MRFSPAAPIARAASPVTLLPAPTMPSRQQQQQQPSREWGRLPNIYWGDSPSLQQLREDPSLAFEALPPVEQVVLAGPESHRYVRQDDPLWDHLHQGVLTTGLVRGALGMYEKQTAKKLGISSSRSGHGELMQAYHRLRQQAPPAASPDPAAAAAAAAHNAAAVAAFNAAKVGAGQHQLVVPGAAAGPHPQDVRQDARPPAGTPAPPAAAAPAPADTAGMSRHARRRLKKQQAKVAAAAQAQAAALQAAAAEVAGAVTEDHKQRRARALGSLGLLSICCSWGHAQEGAALAQVAAAVPGSQLAEVGLCRLQLEELPAEWGFAPGSLPPIGASPDALIRHRRPAEAGAAAGGQDAGRQAAAAAAWVAPMAAVAPPAGAPPPAAAAAPASLDAWDIETMLARAQLLAGSEEPGGIAAASDADLLACSTTANGLGSSDSGSTEIGCTRGSSNSSSCSSVTIASDWLDGSCGCLLEEVVEVKNTCPFGHSRRGGKLRTNEFAVTDRGPRQAVPQEWVPQLQLHMLCAGTPSGLLVSRSATKGTRIFRMRRDDELLRLMLLVISRLWQLHVLPGRPPPSDVYASWREHHDMIRRIGEVARGAELVAVVEAGDAPPRPGSDMRWFLD